MASNIKSPITSASSLYQSLVHLSNQGARLIECHRYQDAMMTLRFALHQNKVAVDWLNLSTVRRRKNSDEDINSSLFPQGQRGTSTLRGQGLLQQPQGGAILVDDETDHMSSSFFRTAYLPHDHGTTLYKGTQQQEDNEDQGIGGGGGHHTRSNSSGFAVDYQIYQKPIHLSATADDVESLLDWWGCRCSGRHCSSSEEAPSLQEEPPRREDRHRAALFHAFNEVLSPAIVFNLALAHHLAGLQYGVESLVLNDLQDSTSACTSCRCKKEPQHVVSNDQNQKEPNETAPSFWSRKNLLAKSLALYSLCDQLLLEVERSDGGKERTQDRENVRHQHPQNDNTSTGAAAGSGNPGSLFLSLAMKNNVVQVLCRLGHKESARTVLEELLATTLQMRDAGSGGAAPLPRRQHSSARSAPSTATPSRVVVDEEEQSSSPPLLHQSSEQQAESLILECCLRNATLHLSSSACGASSCSARAA